VATYDREAITAFAEVFETARQQLEDIRDTMLVPEVNDDDFGESWHDEGGEFIQQVEKIELDLGNLADIMEHLGLSMIDSANRVQAAESEQAERLNRFSGDIADVGTGA
jgi:uncharacterized protein YukE